MACLTSRDLQGATAPRLRRKMLSRKAALLLSSTFLTGCLAISAPALADNVWTGGGADNLWTTPGNFQSAYTQGDDLHFAGTSQLTNVKNSAFAGVRSITFDPSAGAFTLTGNGAMLYFGIANLSTNLQTLSFSQVAVVQSQTWDAQAGNLSITAPVAFDLGLGSAALTITGAHDTSISGAISQFGGGFADRGSLVKTGTGTLTLSANNSYTGGTTVNGGLVNFNAASNFGSGAITLDGGGLQWAAGTTTDISGQLAALGAGGAIFDTNGNDVTFASGLSGAGGITKTGIGTLTLSGGSSYGGATRILGGTLLADSALALPSATVVSIAAAAELKIADGITADIAGLSGSTGSGLVTLGAGSGLNIIGSGAALSFDGHIRDSGDGTLTFGGAGGSQTLTGTSIIGGDLLVGGTAGYVLDISGPAARMEAAQALVLDSALRVSGGASLNLTDIAAGLTVMDSSMVVTGAGTTVTVAAPANIFGSGVLSASLTVADGASMQVGGLVIDDGVVTVSGSGSRLKSDADILVGCGCAGELIVANGATIEVAAGSGIVIDTTAILRIGNGGAAGTVLADRIENRGTIVANFSGSSTFSGVISDVGTLAKTGPGTLILNGANTYTGATTVSGGTLVVNGSIEHSAVTVDAGGAIGGAGRIGALTVNGTLSPGNSPGTLTVVGNLAMGAGSTYVAEVQGPLADRVDVTGTASLAGTLRLVPLGGAYSFNSSYTLLSAAGGRNGTFGTVDSAFGAGVGTEISYTGNEVLLKLTPRQLTTLGATSPANAFAVASAIDGAVANGGNASPLFNLYNQPASTIGAAVNQLSGEAHAGVTALGFQAANQFLGAMLDPNARGRLAGASGGPNGAAGFTADLPSKKSATGPASFDPARFSLWGATFGSRGRTEGERSVGSANRTLDDAHLAVGADILLAPGTVAGVALGFGQARASLSGGVGKIESNVFQAGLYGLTRIGPVDLAAAGGYARLDNDVHRAVPALGNGLTSSYASTAWSGRLQASVQLASWSGLTVSPLAAWQASHVSSPAVVERAGPGGNAGALSLASRDDMTSRSELGMQLDGRTSFGAVPVTGFVRASWAHYFQRDASLTASLIALPGASFSASGARPDQDSALIAAGLDARLSERVSLGIRVDSELSANTRSVGGTARLAVSF